MTPDNPAAILPVAEAGPADEEPVALPVVLFLLVLLAVPDVLPVPFVLLVAIGLVDVSSRPNSPAVMVTVT